MANEYYDILGVERTASRDEISKAYRSLARRYHPDLNPGDEYAKRQFQRIQVAYDTLNDPDKRKLYDRYGEDYVNYKESPFGSHRSGPSGFDFREAFNTSQGFEFRDFFSGDPEEQFREDRSSNPRTRRKSSSSSSEKPSRGESRRREDPHSSPESSTRRTREGGDVAAEIPVPLRIMLEGGDVQFRLNRGNGRVDELRVAIPPDVSPGKRIRLRGLGENRGRGETGDLLLTIQMQPHPALRIDGNNIEFKLPISLHEAIFGANVEIPTSQGEVTIKVPPMSDSGRRLRLKGYGLLGDNHERGDMLVELMIQLPESFPDSLEPKLKELGKGYTNDIRDGIDW